MKRIKKQKTLFFSREWCPSAGKIKLKFSSKAKAERYTRSPHFEGVKDIIAQLTPYYCEECECWHLTHYTQQQCENLSKYKRELKQGMEEFLD